MPLFPTPIPSPLETIPFADAQTDFECKRMFDGRTREPINSIWYDGNDLAEWTQIPHPACDAGWVMQSYDLSVNVLQSATLTNSEGQVGNLTRSLYGYTYYCCTGSWVDSGTDSRQIKTTAIRKAGPRTFSVIDSMPIICDQAPFLALAGFKPVIVESGVQFEYVCQSVKSTGQVGAITSSNPSRQKLKPRLTFQYVFEFEL